MVIAGLVAMLLSTIGPAGAADPPDRVLAVEQYGSDTWDMATDAAALDGGAVVAAYIDTLNSADLLVRRYDQEGALLWSRQLGTSQVDLVPVVAADASGIVVAWNAYGRGEGPVADGDQDVALAQISEDGEVGAVTYLRTGEWDSVEDIAVDPGGVYVTGSTAGTLGEHGNLGGTDLYLARMDRDLSTTWVEQFGTDLDDPLRFFQLMGVAVDDSGVYVVAPLGPSQRTGLDSLIRKFDHHGEVLWDASLISPCDTSLVDVVVLEDAVYVAGPGEEPRRGSASCRAVVGSTLMQALEPTTGAVVWSRELAGHGFGLLSAQWLAGEGDELYVGGEVFHDRYNDPGRNDPSCPRRGYRQDPDIGVVAISVVDGAPRWAASIGSPSAEHSGHGAVSDHGLVVPGMTLCALGNAESAGSADAVTVVFRR